MISLQPDAALPRIRFCTHIPTTDLTPMPGNIDRTAVSLHKLGEEPSDFEYWQSRPVVERMAAVWPLTQSAWALKAAGPTATPPFDAESRLPRHIVHLRKRAR